jgi:hypothetical protein
MLGLENLVSFRTLLVSKQHYPISNEMPDRFCVCVRVSALLACALLKLLLPQGSFCFCRFQTEELGCRSQISVSEQLLEPLRSSKLRNVPARLYATLFEDIWKLLWSRR